jgi:hypothetical protein
MKVKIIARKYKPVEGDDWYKSGDVVELPDAEAKSAIAANVAIDVAPAISPPLQNFEPVAEVAARVRGRNSKEE